MTENEPSIENYIVGKNDDNDVKTGQDEVGVSKVTNFEDDFDDDEFGDFEEAAPIKKTFSIEEPDDPFPESPKVLPEFGFANFAETPPIKPQSFDFSIPSGSNDVKTFFDLIENSSLWDFDDSSSFSLIENDESTIDYFESFDTGKYSEENPPDLPRDYQEALKLWSEVCFVEDTPALKLQWNKTALYSSLLSTLNMSATKAISREKPVIPVLIPTSGAHLELPAHDRVSKILPSGNDQEKSDSQQLSESNATENDNSKLDNFDWHPSGLSSSLDTACISDILDLNFDTNHKNTDDSFEKELQRLGIERSEISTPDTQDLMIDNNSLNLNDILRPTMTGHSETNGIVSELSADARSLLNALPDYGYMLSKILMFPVKR